MTTNQIKFIILGSLAGGFIRLYTEEKTEVAEKIYRILIDSMKRVYYIDIKEYKSMVKEIDIVWQDVLGNTKEKLEIMNIVSTILTYEQEAVTRYGISSNDISKFLEVDNDDIPIEVELKSKEVAEELISRCYDKYKLDKPIRANLSILKKNLIVDVDRQSESKKDFKSRMHNRAIKENKKRHEYKKAKKLELEQRLSSSN